MTRDDGLGVFDAVVLHDRKRFRLAHVVSFLRHHAAVGSRFHTLASPMRGGFSAGEVNAEKGQHPLGCCPTMRGGFSARGDDHHSLGIIPPLYPCCIAAVQCR